MRIEEFVGLFDYYFFEFYIVDEEGFEWYVKLLKVELKKVE